MKNINAKAYMVITLFLASLIATPVMVAGTTYDDRIDFDQFGDGAGLIGSFQQGFGSVFGALGYGGLLIGRVFEMILMQVLTDFESSEMIPGVFVLSAFTEHTINGSRNYGTGKNDYYMVPWEYYEIIPPAERDNLGYPYCNVTTTGSYQFNLTIGAGVTFIIWDHDYSFIEAVKRLLNFFRRLLTTAIGRLKTSVRSLRIGGKAERSATRST